MIMKRTENKDQLIEELTSLRNRLAELERTQAEYEREQEQLKHSLDEAKERRREVSALLEGSRAVLEHRDFENSARAIFDSCKDLIGATAGYVALLTKDGGCNEVLFLDSGDLPCSVDPSLPMPIRGLRAEAYRSRGVVYDNNFSNSEWVDLMPEGHVSLDNVMFAPLVIEGRALGLLGLANKTGGFTQDDARMAQAFGELAAISLRNSRTLESLENSEERLRSVVETATDAIITADSGGNVVFWNRGAEGIFGYSAEEIVGKPLTVIMPTEFHEAHREGLARVVSSGEGKLLGKTVEMTGLRKDGTEFPVELSLARWRTGEDVFFTALLRDIADRKGAEETRRLSQQFLEIANRFSGMHPLLAAFMAEIKQLTGCEAVGVRILDDDGNIPYEAYDGFDPEFYELENSLSIETDECMCINVIRGDVNPKLPFYTEGGSFYMNGTTRFLATVSEKEKGRTRNKCNEHGYESVALVPVRLGNQVVGLIHIADTREHMVPLETVQMLEGIALQLGVAIRRARVEEEIGEVAQFLLENPNPMLRIGKAGAVLYANATGLSLLGDLGSGIGQVAPAPLAEAAAKVMAADSRDTVEITHGEKAYSFTVAPVPGADYMNLYGRDVTKQKKVEGTLHWEAQVRGALAELSSALLTPKPIEDISALVLEHAKRLTGSPLGFVGYIDPLTGYLVTPTLTRDVWHECNVPDKNIVFKKFTGLWGWVLENKKPLLTNAPAADPRSSGTPPGHIPIRRFLSVPALLGDNLVGQVAVANADRDYNEEDLGVVERLAALYSIALQRERAEEEIKNVARFPSENPDPILRIANDGTISYANKASASLLNEWGTGIGQCAPDFMTELAARVLDTGSEEAFELEHTGGTLLFRVVPLEEGAYVNLYGLDITERKRAEERLRKHEQDLEELVKERTAELERSHQELRKLAAHVQTAREEERASVAREIHDELGQVLTGLEMDLSWLNTRLAEMEDGMSRRPLLDKISSMSALVDRTFESVQRIAAELRPGVLDDFGLAAAIESHARQFQERTGIRCSVVLAAGSTDFDDVTATALFRIVQETLTNVARHAKATNVAVSLKHDGNKLLLLVKDDGRGIEGSEVSRSTSLGLLGMRERAVALGGEFLVTSVPGKGTTVKVVVPIAGALEGQESIDFAFGTGSEGGAV